MNTEDRVLTVSQIVRELTGAMKEELDRSTKTCLNCMHFNERSETCEKYDNQRPPARIIASSCEGHVDEIPF